MRGGGGSAACRDAAWTVRPVMNGFRCGDGGGGDPVLIMGDGTVYTRTGGVANGAYCTLGLGLTNRRVQ